MSSTTRAATRMNSRSTAEPAASSLGIVLAKAGLRASLRRVSDRPERRHRRRRAGSSSIETFVSASRALAPFLRFLDQDPYLVVADGRLFWLYDAYTTSTLLPVLDAVRAGELHPQLGEVRHRRLQRHDDRVSRRPGRSNRGDLCAHLPGDVQAARRDAGEHPLSRPLPGGHLRAAGAGLSRRIT